MHAPAAAERKTAAEGKTAAEPAAVEERQLDGGWHSPRYTAVRSAAPIHAGTR